MRISMIDDPNLVLRDLMMSAVICCLAVATVAPGARYTRQLSLPATFSRTTLG